MKGIFKKLKEGNVRILIISESFMKDQEERTEKLLEEADSMGTKVEIVSTDSQRGGQLKELGGIGGLLRYKN